MDEADVIVARAFADLATLIIAQHRASAEAQRLNEQLSGALTSRVLIEQAKGVISERVGTDLAEAFSRLRAYARNSNLRLTDVARAAWTAASIRWPGPRQPARPRPDHPRPGERSGAQSAILRRRRHRHFGHPAPMTSTAGGASTAIRASGHRRTVWWRTVRTILHRAKHGCR